MARDITPRDCHVLINSLVRQLTGQQAITATDSSTFVAAGELVMSTGMENVYNALTALLTRTIIASRPYDAKLNIIQAENESAYASRVRKISYYSKDADPSGDFNTQLYTNFAEGYTSGNNSGASTNSQWEQHLAMPLEMNFAGVSTWQDCITIPEDAVKFAFQNETEFARFVSGFIAEHENDIQSQKEAWNRICLLNKIAGVIDMASYMPGSAVNLTSAFNTKYGTSYLSTDLLTTYQKEFLQFFVSEFRKGTKALTHRTSLYHWSVPVTVSGTTYKILRHTPYSAQRVVLFEPLFIEAKANVYSEIFHPDYLELGAQYEGVDYWQTPSGTVPTVGMDIDVTPAITDANTANATYGTQIAGGQVNTPLILGTVFDKDALMTSYNLEAVRTTPLEARKAYRNTWLSMGKGSIQDFTENTIVYYLSD